jgi:phospholipase/lecithinase/hemolysin
MKRLFIFSTFLLCLLSTTFSQQSGNTIKPNLKYGKPSKEELTMTSFAPDTAYADIQIPYYSNGRNPTLKENVSQLALFLDFRKQVAKQFNNKIIIKRI